MVLLAIYSVNVCAKISVNLHLLGRVYYESLIFSILAIDFEIFANAQDSLFVIVFNVVDKYCTLMNCKGNIWPGVTCDIHQHANY